MQPLATKPGNGFGRERVGARGKPEEAATMSYPIDPSQMLEEHRRRTALRNCIDMMRVGAQSGKSLAQCLKSRFRSRSN